MALVTLGGATPPSAAATKAASEVGNDISFPQCGSHFPTGQAFGIVGVNDGVPGSLNPCLGVSTSDSSFSGSELYWAVATSAGSAAEPKASVYVNTSDPGDIFGGAVVSSWPASGSTPYGTCEPTTVDTSSGPATAGQDSQACAWEFGDQQATQDASWLQTAAQGIDAQSPPVSVPTAPSAYPWWLDVETTNTWRQQATGHAMNVAVLQGFVVGLRAAGAPRVGVYASPNQWAAITGGTSGSTTTLGGIPTWIPGASNETGAQDICGGSSFTAGPVMLAQFPSGNFDGDLSCTVATAVTQPTVTQIYGQTADATAAAEFTRAFPESKGLCPSTRTAIVASTEEFQDALSSQFLAQDLTTGTLLTPTTSLPSVTATTLRDEGITTVYLVGGPLAITTAVATAIGGLTAYACSGKTRSAGKIAVHRIYGETQYGTAMQVAEYVGTAGQRAFPGAYSTTNAAGGSGLYNDTAGTGSAAPFDPLEPTAILASGVEFQDAQAASVISYHTKLPLLLTPASALSTTAVTAVQKLGVKQVVLMGGTLAISDAVEQALVSKTGVSVLRVAGEDYTDTARELARFEAADATAGLGWTPGHRVTVARGDGFTDGLCGAVLDNPHATATGSGGTTRPLLLTERPTVIGTYLTTFLEVTGHVGLDGTKSKAITSLTVLGGPLVVSAAEIAEMQTDLRH
ncbi:MAG: cell wall-binding repeat-containing protein [Acidimicrobiales bacterium]